MKPIRQTALFLCAGLLALACCAPDAAAAQEKFIQFQDSEVTGGRIVTGIGTGVSAGTVKGQIGGDCSVTIKTPKGQTVSDSQTVGTGYKLQVKSASGTVLEDADAIVFGDLSGDGKTAADDLLELKQYVLGAQELSAPARVAAGLSDKESTSGMTGSASAEILRMAQQQLGLAELDQQYGKEKPTYRSTINSLQTILDDMLKPHEGFPHGVPASYDWARKPRQGMGNDPGDFRAMTAWGQIYEDIEGNPATNTRVQVRNMRAYYLSKSQNKWIQLQSSETMEGAAYREDFVDDISVPPNLRDESDNGGGVSVTAGNGYNYHFWPKQSRVEIDPTDIAAMFTTVQARLILDDESKPDDRDQARYLLSMGGDYWLNTSIGWAEFKTNGDFAIGRFRYVTTEWQAFNSWTGDEETIRNNPPPIE